MKKSYFTSILILFGLHFGFAQIINFPDPSFKNYLVNATYSDSSSGTYGIPIDTNGDGEIQVSEALAVRQLNINGNTITSFEGIEFFSNIKELRTNSTLITELDVSVLPNLQTLFCRSTPTLASINFNGLSNIYTIVLSDLGITEIDLSGLPVRRVEITNTQLITIDFSNLSNLTEIRSTNSIVENIITTGCTSLRQLYTSNSNITSLDLSTNSNLEYLSVNDCNLSTLDISGLSSLKILYAFNNSLSNFEYGNNDALRKIDLSLNDFTTLNLHSLPSLTEIDISKNSISSINFGSGLEALIKLDLNDNSLSSINLSSGLESVQNINLDNNLLSSINLNSGLESLKSIRLNNNSISSLEIAGLIELYMLTVGNNGLNNINLSNLPNLTSLSVTSNNLTDLYIDELTNLRYIEYSNNLFSYLDFRNRAYPITIDCDNNPNLEALYFKNGHNDFTFPEQVSSFANCPNLNFICVDEVELAAVQQLIDDYGYSNVTLSTSCFGNPGDHDFEITGISRFNENGNACTNNDVPVAYLQYSINDGSSVNTFFSGSSGAFLIPLSEGDYTITPISPTESYYLIDPINFNVSFPNDASPFHQNICITPNGQHIDVEVFIVPVGIARPGEEAFYKIILRNVGTETTTGEIKLLYDETVSTLVNSNPAIFNQNTDELIWQYNNLNPFETQEIEFSIQINEPGDTPPVTQGTFLSYTVSITPLADENPDNNINTLEQMVVNSMDPNNKICFQGDAIEINAVGDYLYYQINFENLGTADALNVYVKDFINVNYFDIETFVPVYGSHEFTTSVENNLVEFQFIDINLSFNDPNNTGYVVFKIKTKTNLTVGNIIRNGSEIIFDYNEPIITNTATTVITDFLSVGTNDFFQAITLYPNPAESYIMLDGDVANLSYIIYNSIGQAISDGRYSNEGILIENLKSGLYFIKVINENRTETLRFIKI